MAIPPGVVYNAHGNGGMWQSYDPHHWTLQYDGSYFQQYASEYDAAREFIRLSGNWTHMERALDAQEIHDG